MTRVLFVCLGNICRSPTAEAVFRAFAVREGLAETLEIASCGTGHWHVGEGADRRTLAHAKKRGYDLLMHRAKPLNSADFERFDLILAMDGANLADLKAACPPAHAHKLGLFLDHASEADTREVPDPYYGGAEGFERVLDLAEDASRGLLAHLRRMRAA